MISPVKQMGSSLRYRCGIVARSIAAIVGGYGLAASTTALLALLLPLSRGDAVITATLLSFIVYTCAVVWVFAVRTAWRAWLGLGTAIIVTMAVMLLYRGAV